MAKMKCLLVVLLVGLVLLSACGAPASAPPSIAPQTPQPAPTAEPTPPLAPIPTPPVTIPSQFTEAKVVRVIDGDTIEVSIDGEFSTVRYIGIDTPEVGEPYSDEATRINRRLVEGQTISLEKDISDTDKYGRSLRYVYVEPMSDGFEKLLKTFGGSLEETRAILYISSLIRKGEPLFVNAILVTLGYAEAYPYPPDTKYADYFTQLQQEAKDKGWGMWEQSSATTPTPTTKKYVGSINSNIYHYPSCIWAQKINPENEIWFTSVADAKVHGYRACKVCKPPGSEEVKEKKSVWEQLEDILRMEKE